MPKKKTGISRRRAITIASAATASTVLPSWTGPVASVEAETVGRATSIQLGAGASWWCNYIGLRLEPAWKVWREAAVRYERHFETARTLRSSDDMDEIMEHRIHPDVIAFDIASRRVERLRRLLWLTNPWSVPNEAARAIRVSCERYYEEMVASETFGAMRALSSHIVALEALGHRAKDHQLKRAQQTDRQFDFSREFKQRFGVTE